MHAHAWTTWLGWFLHAAYLYMYDCHSMLAPKPGWHQRCPQTSPQGPDVTESSGLRQELCLAPAVHPTHSQLGHFAIYTKLLTVIVMQPGGSCNMTTSLVADDLKAYMVILCSPGYYGPLCSLCLLHNAAPGQPRYGRTGTLGCQKCRCDSGLPCICPLLHPDVCAGLASLCPCCSHSCVQFCCTSLALWAVSCFCT